jgi:internalin A
MTAISCSRVASVALANMPKLIDIYAQQNQISDPSPLSSLTQLNIVDLIANQLTDLSPLAANPALETGDFVYVAQNQLACAAQAANIQAMQDRGVSVSSDCP